jgi:hypothetical protein
MSLWPTRRVLTLIFDPCPGEHAVKFSSRRKKNLAFSRRPLYYGLAFSLVHQLDSQLDFGV